MLLDHFTNVRLVADFDPETGSADGFRELDDVETVGYSAHLDFGWVAIYPDPDEYTLVLQIGDRSWDIYDSATTVHYSHNYDEETTTVTITDGETTFEKTYEAWWSGVEWFEPNRWSASSEPENVEEDILAYVLYLQAEADRKADFIDPWLEKMQDGE